MLANLFLWTILGILAGAIIWVLFPTDDNKLAGTIAAGLAGAFFGGSIYSIFSIGSVAIKVDPGASFIAIISSIVIVYAIRYVYRERDIK